MATLPCYPNPLVPFNAYHALLLSAGGYLARSLGTRPGAIRAAQAEKEQKTLNTCARQLHTAHTHLAAYERFLRQFLPADALALPAGRQSFEFIEPERFLAYQRLREEAFADSRILTSAILASPLCSLPSLLKPQAGEALNTIRQFTLNASRAHSLENRLAEVSAGIDAAAIALTLLFHQLEAAARKTGPL